MALTKRVKNTTQEELVLVGTVLVVGEYYEIPLQHHIKWGADSTVRSKIISGELVVNDGTSDLESGENGSGIKYLDTFPGDANSINGISIDNSNQSSGRILKLKTDGSQFEFVEDLSHSHSNKSQLDLITDGDHDVRSDNPHSTNKADVGLGDVPNLDTTSAVNNSHSQTHSIDSSTDHGGVDGATEDNFISFNDQGLPQDSGTSSSDFADASHTHLEQDITDLDHDAQKIKGVTVDDSQKANGKILKYNSTSENLEYADDNSSGGGHENDRGWARSTGKSSRTSKSYGTKVTLSHTVPETADYEITACCVVSSSDTGIFMKTRLQVDSTNYQESTEELSDHKYEDGAWFMRSMAIVIPNLSSGNHTIRLQYATGESGKAMYIKEAYITIRRID